MLYIIKHKLHMTYSTIKEKEVGWFNSLGLKNFEIVFDEYRIKDILEKNFSSRNRTEQYDTNMPSVSNIVGDLFPQNLSAPFLLKWLDNQTVDEREEQNRLNVIAQDKGTMFHKVLELYLKDFDKRNILKSLDDYLALCKTDDELNYKIPHLNTIQSELDTLAREVLTDFCSEEMCNIDCLFSEIYLRVPEFLQGEVDLVFNSREGLYVGDFKTTSSIDKKTGKPKHKTMSSSGQYQRQVFLYSYMMYKLGVVSYKEFRNMKYRIYQFQLVGKYCKTLELPTEKVLSWERDIMNVIDWYWEMRNL